MFFGVPAVVDCGSGDGGASDAYVVDEDEIDDEMEDGQEEIDERIDEREVDQGKDEELSRKGNCSVRDPSLSSTLAGEEEVDPVLDDSLSSARERRCSAEECGECETISIIPQLDRRRMCRRAGGAPVGRITYKRIPPERCTLRR